MRAVHTKSGQAQTTKSGQAQTSLHESWVGGIENPRVFGFKIQRSTTELRPPLQQCVPHPRVYTHAQDDHVHTLKIL